jgi:hypothetical protein
VISFEDTQVGLKQCQATIVQSGNNTGYNTDVLGDIVSLAGCTPSHVGESEAWKAIADHAEQDKQNLCKVLQGKKDCLVHCMALIQSR